MIRSTFARLAISIRLCLASLFVLTALTGCKFSGEKFRIGRGTGYPCVLTVGHVVEGPTIKRGNITFDVYNIRNNKWNDPICLLIPRYYGDLNEKYGPGDSGSPVRDEEGRVVGFHLGRRNTGMPD